jgi:hypothetical protein
VSGYQTASPGGVGDTITLSFGKVEEDYTPLNPDGSAGTPVRVAYDVATNTGGASGISVSATPVFSALLSPTIVYGTATTTLTGHLAADTLSPPAGENVLITLDGVTQTAPLDGNGNFSSPFNTAALGVAGSPYTVSYNYDGDSAFFGASDSGTLTVTQKTLTVTASDNSKTYGQTASDTGTLSGVVNNDGITATFSSPGDPATAAVGTGSYPITATLNDPNGKLGNYAVQETDATLTVYRADLYVTANANSKIVGETASDTGTLSGVVNNDGITATFSSPGDPATAAAGNYTISATLNDPNGRLSNYTVHETDATLTVITYAQATTNIQTQVDNAGLDHGTQNSLDSQLQAATASFNKGNTTAGTNQLQAFINNVNAQRGKKISAALADMLIAEAQRIINAVG